MKEPSIYLYIICLALLYKLISEGYWTEVGTKLAHSLKKNRNLILVVIVVVTGVVFADAPISTFLQNNQHPWLTKIAQFGNSLGDGELLYSGLVMLVVLALILNQKIYQKLIAVSLMSSAYAGIAVNLLKILILRQRPFVTGNPFAFFQFAAAYQQGKWFDHSLLSMPSGHTITVIAALTPLFLYCKNKIVRTGLVLLGLSTAFGRIYTYVHWTSDVLMGAVLGGFLGWVIYSVNQDKLTI